MAVHELAWVPDDGGSPPQRGAPSVQRRPHAVVAPLRCRRVGGGVGGRMSLPPGICCLQSLPPAIQLLQQSQPGMVEG